jgi:hypothetical protein
VYGVVLVASRIRSRCPTQNMCVVPDDYTSTYSNQLALNLSNLPLPSVACINRRAVLQTISTGPCGLRYYLPELRLQLQLSNLIDSPQVNYR